MSDDLPAFGPSETFPCDENADPHAVVTLSLTVTREQLRAALAVSHAEMAGYPDLADLTVIDTRREIEGYLAAAAVLRSEPELQAVHALLSADYAAELDAAIDRAYTRPSPGPKPVRKLPRYSDGTVTIDTFDQGDVTVPEPTWCTGHGWQPNPHRTDITHRSVMVKAGATVAGRGWVDILLAYISHAPYLVGQTEPHPVVSVELDVKADFTAEEIVDLNRGLHLAVIRLARLAAEAIHLRDGGQA